MLMLSAAAARSHSPRRWLGHGIAALSVWSAAFTGGICRAQSAPTAAQLDFFERKIRPVLVEHCYECHSQGASEADALKAGLMVDSRSGVRDGGDSGAAVLPGDPDASLLIQALRYESFEMPPEGKLSEQVIADFETWVRDGAADPRDAAPAVALRQPIDMDAARRHWAYRPLPLPPIMPSSGGAGPPTGQTADGPIDAFIAARLDEAGLEPLPEADRRTLVRRLYFDLIGLPPTPEQIDDFVNDPSPDAYHRLVDRLIAAPEFGQRWGRHWLDVARFAESVTLRGLVQHQAWRYRDYVIDSFNRDLPYDRFMIQQIAGDLIPEDSVPQRRRNLVATTFLTLGNANLEDQDKEKLRMDVVDEQLTVIGAALLAQTIGCARCHDHKFDPISTREYYALAGILRGTKTLEHANVSRWIERPLPLPPAQELRVRQYEQTVAELRGDVESLQKLLGTENSAAQSFAAADLPGIVVDDQRAEYVGEWPSSQSVRPYIGQGYRHDGNEARGQKSVTFETMVPTDGIYEVRLAYTAGGNRSSAVQVAVAAAGEEHQVTIDQRHPGPIDGLFVSLGQFTFTSARPATVTVSNRGADGHVVVDAVQFLSQDEMAEQTRIAEARDTAEVEARRRELRKLQGRLKELERDAPHRPQYMAVEEEEHVGDMRIHIRGNVHNLGDSVPRGFPRVVSYHPPAEIPPDQSGRLQLAHWLADPANPLPARVMANRLWHWLFGAGLVRTPDNFGHSGDRPTHPRLLDYLAGQLVHNGWSVKALVRQIVLSDAYRRHSQSATVDSLAASSDPDNRLLWRMNRRRLEAECMLDAILSISGQIDTRLDGKTIPDALADDYGYEHDSVRRAIYWPTLRNSPPELLRVFDGANPSLVTGRRNSSSVAPQSLYLMNDPWIIQQSEHAARRLLDEPHASDDTRLDVAFRRCLGRPPSEAERRASIDFLGSPPDADDAERLQRWSQLVQTLFCTLEFRYLP